MTFDIFFGVIFLAAVSVQRLLETFKRRDTARGEQQMRWSLYAFAILHAVIIGGALTEFLLLRQKLAWGWSAAGLVIFAVSLLIRNLAIRALGKFWSLQVEIRAQHEIVRQGVYRLVRHPAYSSIVLEVLSIPMTVNAWWTMLFAAVTYIPLLIGRLRVEERALVAKFGDAYRAYQQEVGALFPRPRFSGRHSP